MTLDEYKRLLSAVTDPDAGATAILSITDGLQNDLAELAGLKTKVEENQTTINALRDSNSKLVLRITEPSTATADTEEEETPEKALASLKELIIKKEET